MSIFNHFQNINPTNVHHHAFDKLHTFFEFDKHDVIIHGYNGKGKTSILKYFIVYLKSLNNLQF